MPYYTKQQLTGSGRLRINAFAPNVSRPADNALVRITPSGVGNQIIEELLTDSSGQTPVINLPAPPEEYSMEPGQPMPYSAYDVQVLMEGYDTQIIRGVQILPNATAEQNVRLNPSETSGLQTQVVTIQDNKLWGSFPPKIPEDDVKPLPPSTGYIVLPEPVIPEFIIVHDGRPNDSLAANYWVPFKDYIKNVASSEIYSTWPQSTITANVLAIISFTLNRVYTEWYRAKGYNFTITSSTAFDHAFSYGRNLFDEISEVVDNVFTTYITKPGIRQPLLTQYCDGQKVSCPDWMTQWGSKTLGDEGYSAVDILKHFYGYEIYLMQSKLVAGVPSSYPNTPLQIGATGENVRVIQQQLNTIASHYPAIPKVRVDGIFGDSTRIAIEAFQRIFQLSADGIVGFSTWYKLSDIYTGVTKIAELF